MPSNGTDKMRPKATAIAYEKGSRRSKNFKQILMRKSASFTFEINAALVGFFVFEEIETQMAKDIHVFSGKAGTHTHMIFAKIDVEHPVKGSIPNFV